MRVKSRQTHTLSPIPLSHRKKSTSICVCCVYDGCIHHPWMDALGLVGASRRIASHRRVLPGARPVAHPWAMKRRRKGARNAGQVFSDKPHHGNRWQPLLERVPSDPDGAVGDTASGIGTVPGFVSWQTLHRSFEAGLGRGLPCLGLHRFTRLFLLFFVVCLAELGFGALTEGQGEPHPGWRRPESFLDEGCVTLRDGSYTWPGWAGLAGPGRLHKPDVSLVGP